MLAFRWQSVLLYVFVIKETKSGILFINKAKNAKLCVSAERRTQNMSKLFIQRWKMYIIYYRSRFNSWLLICTILEWQNIHRINKNRIILLKELIINKNAGLSLWKTTMRAHDNERTFKYKWPYFKTQGEINLVGRIK